MYFETNGDLPLNIKYAIKIKIQIKGAKKPIRKTYIKRFVGYI